MLSRMQVSRCCCGTTPSGGSILSLGGDWGETSSDPPNYPSAAAGAIAKLKLSTLLPPPNGILPPTNYMILIRNVNVAPPDQFLTASISLGTSWFGDSGTSATLKVFIDGYDADTVDSAGPGPWATGADVDVAARTASSTSVFNWSEGTGTWAIPRDLSTILNEIINRAGWVAGNNIMLFVNESGSTWASSAIITEFLGATLTDPVLTYTYG